MRLTLQLNAIDNMSKVVQSASSRSMKSLNGMATSAQQRADQARGRMFESGVATAAGAAALAYPLKMAGNYERLRVSMDALTGSSAKGLTTFNSVVKLASETPLSLEMIAKNVVMMIGYGQAANDATKSVKMLGDITALTNGDIGNAIVAYGQARQEGKMLTRDLRQFINAGVPIISILKQQLGANADIFKMASDGAITFDLLNNALSRATNTGGQFANGLKKLSETGPGLFMRMSDEGDRLAAVFGDALLPALKDYGKALIPVMSDTAEWLKNHKGLTKVMMGSAVLFTGIAVATFLYAGAVWMLNTALTAATGSAARFIMLHLGVFAIMGKLSGLGTYLAFVFKIIAGESLFLTNVMNIGLVPALVKARFGMTALNVVMLANPIGALIAIIAAMVAYIGIAIYKWNEFGASIMLLMGPVGWLVNAFMSIKTHWTSITSAFRDGGFFEGIKRIGVVLMDSMLYPIQQLMGLIAKVTGFDWAKSAHDSVMKFRVSHDLANSSKSVAAVNESVSPSNASSALDTIGPTASARAASSSNSNQVSIAYSPTITIGAGATAEEEGSFATMLDQHKDEIARMVQEVVSSNDRKSFA